MYIKCQKCGRRLTDPESKRRGYGPECWESITGQQPFAQTDLTNYEVPGQMSIEDFLVDNNQKSKEGQYGQDPL